MRPVTLSALLVLPAALVCAALVPTPPPCVNVFAHEPVVVYEVTGNTLCCQIDVQLTVFSDGWVRANRAAGAEGAPAGGKSQVGQVPVADVQALLGDLAQLGAGTSCDQPDLTSDTPLSTLTLLRGTTDARAHSWSWLGDDGHGGAIAARLDQFLQAAFPGF